MGTCYYGWNKMIFLEKLQHILNDSLSLPLFQIACQSHLSLAGQVFLFSLPILVALQQTHNTWGPTCLCSL